MRFLGSQRFLAVYSGLVTLAFCITILCGFVLSPKRNAFEEIDVQRINLVEPDGKLRMVISDRTRFPGSYIGQRNSKQRPKDHRNDFHG